MATTWSARKGSLRGIVLLCDRATAPPTWTNCRSDPAPVEASQFLVLLTKADKLNCSEAEAGYPQATAGRRWRGQTRFSALKKQAVDERQRLLLWRTGRPMRTELPQREAILPASPQAAEEALSKIG